MNPLPRVAVIVPTRNRADLLRRCLTALACQPYANYQVLVVDDGDDNTPDVVASFGMQYLRHSGPGGPGPQRNTGIRAAGDVDIIAFTDDDVVVPSLWLPRIVEAFLHHPDVGSVGGALLPRKAARHQFFAQQERFTTLRLGNMGREPMIGTHDSPVFGTNNIAYRREALVQAGGFDERFTADMVGEDDDLKWRVLPFGWKFLYIPNTAAHWRKYTRQGFVNQHIARGKAAARVPVMHGGPPPSRVRVLLRVGVRTLRAARRIVAGWPPKMILACWLADVIDCYGQWKALDEMNETPIPPARSNWL